MADADWDFISSCAGLLCLATLSIYCGAFGSLPNSPRSQSTQKGSLLQDDDEDEDEDEDIPGRMSSGDAWLFPIVGSAVLFGLYVIIKYLGKEWINWLLGWYTSIVGVGSVWKSVVSLAKFVLGRERWKSFDRNRLIFLRGPLEVVSLSFRTPTIALLPVGMLPSILYSFSAETRKSALLTDILAISLSFNALSILKLDTFQTGCILLSGLFIYDVWWVFGTEVMVKVATSLDMPIKLLWPKSVTFATERGFTMLGLGDVVIPGLFIALALRYDQARAEKTQVSFAKPYFTVTLTAYVLGLITTMRVMHLFGTAQPALLYLSPACILSLIATAVVRGELEDVWRWSDDPELSQQQKSAQEAAVESRALPEAQNGTSTPPLNAGCDGNHMGAEAREVVGEEDTAEEVKPKKRKNKGKKNAREEWGGE